MLFIYRVSNLLVSTQKDILITTLQDVGEMIPELNTIPLRVLRIL